MTKVANDSDPRHDGILTTELINFDLNQDRKSIVDDAIEKKKKCVIFRVWHNVFKGYCIRK